jgi:TRAP-type C4-dicarboxylate transport system permease small subunit
MTLKARYIAAMDKVHQACVFVAGASLVVIVLIVPYGVFCRYALNSAASWPEPLATLLMIVVSFLSAVVCYREYLHIGVGVLPALLHEPAKSVLGWILEVLMLATNLFMLIWGVKLCQTTWFQSTAEFPLLAVGVAYLPIPIGGALTALFVIERLLKRKFFVEPEPETMSQLATE